ncbi:28S ribosomal protein S18b, mitochondrial [Clonorchis sinensis]|uniref:Small ribosomal subunit protein mS40 n=1 Tax=Clonorchis sinensis TaxID=79923 RepID=A0A8T1M026_CLOSI|nr:28S ribosomal protein S18b, mitochondrial [Clonorchis sinensis]
MFRIATSPLLLRPLALKSLNTSCTMWASQIKPHTVTSCVPTTLTSTVRLSSGSTRSSSVAEDEIDSPDIESSPTVDKQSMTNLRKNYKGKLYTPVDLSTSLDYMNSEVYLNIYQGKPVWFYYRRNFKGHFPPPRTRPNCVVGKRLVSSNPCPICRDEYLILDYRNTELLRQFLNPITLEILETSRTGLCQHQHKKLLLEIAKAQDLGTIETWLPFHLYDYSEYYSYLPKEQLNELLRVSGCGPQNIMDDRGSLDVTHASSADLAELPVNLQNLLGSIELIPRASLGQPPPPETKIIPPKIPNRYKMEEDHKALVAKRRKSRTLILQ